ncbi:alpha/beta hydrolase [Microcoleus sp. FACHB-1515]|uniref:alpha/beta hydrolase n=1 Tax=Cyanophyceae TaxID=3028117 RepID=UPI001689FF92|nr:alpha/beta hydrolase [Microcoleus sp. FACHB-1515]MBD2090147.1 alpha/beta hydrolase [Microcoleus sp. FACHB-1515]
MNRPMLTDRFLSFCRQSLLGSGLGLLLSVPLAARPAQAVQRIYFSYGAFERSVSFEAIETYARTGKITGDLVAYARYATPEQLEQLREILQARADIDAVAVSQFLYTEQGEAILERVGNLIQTESHKSGFYAIRSALILAAADSQEGLTPLNFLRQFPLAGLRVEIDRTLAIADELEDLVNESTAALAAVQTEFELEAATPIDPALPDLRTPGPNRSQRQTITLVNRQRDRVFLADVYLPVAPANRPPLPAAPVIVISHGLGSDRTSFAYLAEHLASYGFAVALVEHPGSNTAQLEALLSGRAGEVIQPEEFVDRALDIRLLLNDLNRRSRNDPLFRGRLNVQQVGVIGQSFGGYTALALAGAEINRDQLRQDCPPGDSFNLSLLLQCQANDLPQRTPRLRDDRIKAVMALNPFNSSIFGQENLAPINLPVMIVSGSADTVTPALFEQIRPFTWLTTPDRFLLLLRGGTHFSTIGPSENPAVDLPPEVIGPDPTIARRYISAFSVAFFQTYLANQPSYRPYLSAAYANRLSQAPLPLQLVRSLTPEQLATSLSNSSDRTPTPSRD